MRTKLSWLIALLIIIAGLWYVMIQDVIEISEGMEWRTEEVER